MLTRQKLIDAIEDINAIFDGDIDISAPEKELIEIISADAKSLVEGDALKDSTWSVLRVLNVGPFKVAQSTTPTKPQKKKSKRRYTNNKKKRFTRNDALVLAIRRITDTGATQPEIIETLNAIYNRRGGSKTKYQNHAARCVLYSLVEFGILECKKDKYYLIDTKKK